MTTDKSGTYPFPVRPGHRETFDNYAKRLTVQNFENAEHLRARVREAQALQPDSSERFVLESAVLPTLAGRSLVFLEPHPAGWLTHPDGSHCNACTQGVGERSMCTHCANGQDIRQNPHFDGIVCVRHRRWVGLYGTHENQRPVGQEHIRAALGLERLRRRGRVDPRLYRTVIAALTSASMNGIEPGQELQVFPMAVAVITALTSKPFARRIFDPSTPWARSFDLLRTTLESIVGDACFPAVRILWLYLRPTAAQLRAGLLDALTSPPVYAHDYPLHSWVLEQFAGWSGVPQPHSSYLVASRDTIHTAYETALAVERVVGISDGKDVVELICARGHRWDHIRAPRAELRKSPTCPVCPRHLPTPGKSDLNTTHPEIATAFDFTRNGGLSAWDVKAGSSEIYWWKCPAGHSYNTTASNRTYAGVGCRYCNGRGVLQGYNDLATTHPHVASEWGSNGLHTPRTVSPGSNIKVTWLCAKGHSETDRVRVRVDRSGCATCLAEVNRISDKNLAVTHPAIAALWHPELNANLRPEHVTYGSGETVWWLCELGHESQQRIDRKTSGYGCGPCSHRVVLAGFNDVATTHPELVAEWHSWKNNLKEPDEVMAGTRQYWWRCRSAGHEYQQSVPNRMKSRGCPECPPEVRIAA